MWPHPLNSFEMRKFEAGDFSCFLLPVNSPYNMNIYTYQKDIRVEANVLYRVKSKVLIQHIGELSMLYRTHLVDLGFVKEPTKGTARHFSNWWKRQDFGTKSAYLYGVERVK